MYLATSKNSDPRKLSMINIHEWEVFARKQQIWCSWQLFAP